MAKIKNECMFCEKEKNGKCQAKKNVTVKLTKHRFCTKFVHSRSKEAAELKRKAYAYNQGKCPVIHRLSEDYYKQIWAEHYIMVTPGVRYKLNHPSGQKSQ